MMTSEEKEYERIHEQMLIDKQDRDRRSTRAKCLLVMFGVPVALLLGLGAEWSRMSPGMSTFAVFAAIIASMGVGVIGDEFYPK
jgi:hypothetical protein